MPMLKEIKQYFNQRNVAHILAEVHEGTLESHIWSDALASVVLQQG